MKWFTVLVMLAPFLAAGDSEETPPPPPPPNLAVNGDFEKGETAPEGWDKPDGTRVRWGGGLGEDGSRGLRFDMDEETAFGYGQGHFSHPVAVDPQTEYRVSVDVRSDQPNAIVFIKGYAKVRDKVREVYSKHKEVHFDRYLGGDVGSGRFVRQSFTFHPRHGAYPVEYVKVWLYGYLKPGTLDFDNVRVERVSKAEPSTDETGKKRPAPMPSTNSNKPIYLDPGDF